ncbi:hypothetical protein N0V88_003951 [Collariella sp. IMI 366227]|nr:hypothetical protein N0V88_003951 [Collariella sp. IMI 366227]
MSLNISESGVLLESSAKEMAGLPQQAFAIALSGSMIEDMIACVQGGGDIQLALGSTPKFLFDDHEVRIPKSPDPSGYELLWTDSEYPSTISKLPNPAMSIFFKHQQKPKAKALQTQALKLPAKGAAKAKASLLQAPKKASNGFSAPRPTKVSSSQEDLDDAIENLKSSYATLEADKRENSAVVVSGLPTSRGGKVKPAKRLLEAQAAASPRSLPPSPALSGVRSPSLAPSSNNPQERQKQHRFPIIHELAVRSRSLEELSAKWNEGTEQEFSAALRKVADFDREIQKWVLRAKYYKELDVFAYNYAREQDRQKAIDNAIKQYDRLRLGTSEEEWQRLLPKSDRGKGICLSKLQATFANKSAQMPAPKSKPDAAGHSGADSDHSASSVTKKGKEGEPMSRSSSQTSIGKKKLSSSEAQAKRMLSTTKKPVRAPSAKPASKVSPAKTTAKGPAAKGGRVLSKEFVSESSSSEDEAPLSKSMPKSKAVAGVSKLMVRASEKPKPFERTKESAPLKPKPTTTTKALPRDGRVEREKDTIRAVAKPIRPGTKRPRDADDDDSSSSGTPLSKRVKPITKAPPAPTAQPKGRTASDKTNPLTRPRTAPRSNVESDRPKLGIARPRERVPERERDRNTSHRSMSASSNTTDSGVSIGLGIARKRPAVDSLPPSTNRAAKRHRLSQETMEMAAKFKQFYVRYEQLHSEMVGHENPDPNKMVDLLDMHERLSRMKNEIYASVEA